MRQIFANKKSPAINNLLQGTNTKTKTNLLLKNVTAVALKLPIAY